MYTSIHRVLRRGAATALNRGTRGTSCMIRSKHKASNAAQATGSRSTNAAGEPPAIDNQGIVSDDREGGKDAVEECTRRKGKKVWKAAQGSVIASIWEKGDFNEGLKELKPFDDAFRTLGVNHANKDLDLKVLINNYTAPALAAGLRDREETLQLCARLLAENDIERLKAVLHPYQDTLILRRRRKRRSLDLSTGLSQKHINALRKYLHRAPRQITRAVSVRASVVIPLCNVEGVASILFERRSASVRSFKNQVCFPGGMVEENTDHNIIDTSLREMEEEIGVPADIVDVLGVLRCDWSEVAKITGIGVTPVVGFLGELSDQQLRPNPAEVSECFTIPIHLLLDQSMWVHDEANGTVAFLGGPHVIWGLTAYILDRFLSETVRRYEIADGSGIVNGTSGEIQSTDAPL